MATVGFKGLMTLQQVNCYSH